jgi:26S proteasome regulatory subunit N13
MPFLPPDLLAPSSPVAGMPRQEMLRKIVASAPFRASVRSLDQALSTGLLGGLVTNLGMPVEAGLGVHPFLEAIQAQATQPDDTEQRADHDENRMNTE